MVTTTKAEYVAPFEASKDAAKLENFVVSLEVVPDGVKTMLVYSYGSYS